MLIVRIKNISRAGDTIIEVLIALSVIGAVIGGAYASASRSLNVGRQAQERAEATRVAESQVEAIKALLIENKSDIGDSPEFCITTNNEVQDTNSSRGSITKSAVLSVGTSASEYNAACVFGPNRYFTSVSKNNNLYSVLVRWERIGGGIDEIQMLYRAYPGSN
jgi:type II secretory pathway pseudopilin PulG